jgi:hypothetical protein
MQMLCVRTSPLDSFKQFDLCSFCRKIARIAKMPAAHAATHCRPPAQGACSL